VARIARTLETDDAAQGLYDLAGRLGVKRALRDIGMPADGIGEVVERTVDDPSRNPRPLDRDAIRDLLTRAWSGEPPRSP
jgi:maleylacetate reductase